MPKSGFTTEIRLLVPDDWVELRNIRLAALQESPEAFLSTYRQEVEYDPCRWRTEFDRGNWYIGICAGAPVSLLGVTRGTSTPVQERYLEYLWVSPEYRRSGIASRMLIAVLERLRDAAVGTTFVWVIDGNEAARRLYEQIGFVSSNHRQSLTARPGRSEEKLVLTLT